MSAFFESDGPGAGNLAADVPVDKGGDGGDGVEKLDPGTLFHPQVTAAHLANDFAVAADDQIPAAFDRAGQFTQHGEVVALQGDTRNRAGFTNDNVATGLDAAVPRLGNRVIDEADVTAALGALAGLGLEGAMVRMATIEAPDLALGPHRIEPAHQERALGWRRWFAIECEFGWLWCCGRLGIALFSGLRNEDYGAIPNDALAIAHFEVGAAGAALSGDHQGRFCLFVPAFWA